MDVRLLHKPKYFLQKQICPKLSGINLNQKQSFTGVYGRLQKNAYFSWVSLLLKLQAYSLKKTHPEMFSYVCLILENTFFAKHIWVVTASAKCHSFSLLHRPHHQNATLDLGYVLTMIKYFQNKHCESLVNSCFWKSKTINWFIAHKTSNTSKMVLEIRSSRPAIFFKIMFCKTSQVSQESVCEVTFS